MLSSNPRRRDLETPLQSTKLLKLISSGESVCFIRNSNDYLVTFELNGLKKEQNDLSKAIGLKIKESKGAEKCEEEKAQSNQMKEKIEQVEKQLSECDTLRSAKLNTIGNLVYHDVPISKDEA